MFKHLLQIVSALVLGVLLFSVLPASAQMSLTITSPQNNEVFDACSDIIITTDLTITSGTFKEVRFYYNSKAMGLVRKEPYQYTWKGVKQGNYEITAKVIDKDLTEYWADPVSIRVGNIEKGDMLFNGGFDCNSPAPWTLQNNDVAVSSVALMNDGYFEDSSYVMIDIENPGSADWHIQYQQPFVIKEGHTYEVWFYADTPSSKSITVGIQGNYDPYPAYLWQTVVIDGPQEYGPISYEAGVDDANTMFKFNLGGSATNFVLDKVRVYDLNATGVDAYNYNFKEKTVSKYQLFQSYPNPFNMDTKIPFQLSQNADVKLEIYNMQGQKVKTLLSGMQSEGYHSISWDGTNDSNSVLSSGVYIYRFQVESEKVNLSRKVLLLK